jgi:hypothetical protein
MTSIMLMVPADAVLAPDAAPGVGRLELRWLHDVVGWFARWLLPK